MTHSTPQEAFWQGDFGNDYVERNRGAAQVASNTAFFSKVLSDTQPVTSILELGSNIGLNLIALHRLLPTVQLSAVEINQKAADQCQAALPQVELHVTSILEFAPDRKWDLVFTKGVLIHIHPDRLPAVYDLMYRSSARYILVAEYYNPAPVEVPYRGHAGVLFKRDFAGEMMERFPSLSLAQYGFVYRRDPNFPQDDLTWFLLQKFE